MKPGLAMNGFLNAGGGGSVQLTDQTVIKAGSFGTVTAGYRINSSGEAESRKNGTYAWLETWLLSGSASGYDVKATVTSGSLSSGTTDTWLNCGTSREWYVQNSIPGTSIACTFTVELRPTGGGSTLDSATINLQADR